jgi:uncharacterized membrane protein
LIAPEPEIDAQVKDRELEESRRVRGMDRTLALSDGIFAFAITLLALDLVTPVIVGPATDASLAGALINEFHSFSGFFVSFWIISMLWLSHHRIFSYIKSTDAVLLSLNLVLLFFVVLVPFATRVLNYGYLQPALDVFALIQVGALLMNSIIWRYASRPDRHLLLDSRISPKTKEWLSNRGFVGAFIFVLSIFLAYVNPYITIACWLSVFPLIVLLDRKYTKQTTLDRGRKKLGL